MKALLILLILCPATLLAADPLSSFREANRHYAAGEYSEAGKIYSGLIEQGHLSPSLFYNQGNTFFRLGKLPHAILYYEKALELNPGHSAALHNLELSRKALPLRQKIDPAQSAFSGFGKFLDGLPADRWTAISLQLLLLSLLGFATYLLMKKRRMRRTGFYLGLLFTILFIVTTFFAFERKSRIGSEHFAVVLDDQAYAFSAPGRSGTELFRLSAGWKVKISRSSGDWREVALPDGSRGWVKLAQIGII